MTYLMDVPLPREELFEADVALEVAVENVSVLDVHPQDVHRLVTLGAEIYNDQNK